MNKHRYDIEYTTIVDPILLNNEFNKLDDIEHHGTTRLEHSLKVSYYSYKIAKALKLNYQETARAGLLHDFFLSDEERTKTERFLSMFTHPKKALNTATDHFELNNIEENIIVSHMFPLNLHIPKYRESWIVSTVDKVIAVKEFSYAYQHKFKRELAYITNISLICLLSFIK